MIIPTVVVFARPKPLHVHRPVPHVHRHHAPVHHKHVHHKHHHHHHSPIVPLVSGFVGGLIGSTLIDNTPTVVQTTPVVVQSTPVVVQSSTTVWKPGYYEDRVQPNGTVIRVWVPGRYVTVP